MPNWTHSFYRDPAYKKKMSDAVKKARAKETPEQRKAHNRKLAIAYRHTVGTRLLQGEPSYARRRDIRKWMDAIC